MSQTRTQPAAAEPSVRRAPRPPSQAALRAAWTAPVRLRPVAGLAADPASWLRQPWPMTTSAASEYYLG